MLNKRVSLILVVIFLFALILRFLYFPQDIYFGIDQAIGSFATQEILHGHPKLIGPSTTFEGLRHGVLFYYLYAPFYFFGRGDPSVAAAFLRVVNASGVVLIFLLGSVLFNRVIGAISAYLFAISFEQTQFALYFNHPSLAIISILIMYLGLALLIFRKKEYGLIIAFLGLGLSIQFEFILTYLAVPFLIILFFFRKSINFSPKIIFLGLTTFFLTISSFLLAEIKFSFRGTQALSQLLFQYNQKSLFRIFATYVFEMGQILKFNLIGITQLKLITELLFVFTFIATLFSSVKKQMIFLGIWFFSGIVVYFVTGGEDLNVDIIQYHPNMGLSLSLIIFVSYLFFILSKKTNYYIVLILLFLIFAANFSLIQKINPYGSMPEINAQSFMLLSDEKKVLDYIYNDSNKKTFAVKGITLPFYINTTWSYLFEWYGKQKYGYLPIWGGKNASGYPGNLIVENAQDKLPKDRYLIIEPVRGIPVHLINNYIEEENIFTNLIEEKHIGKFIVQKRIKK